MSEQVETTWSFTHAVRAVLMEMDIDGLPAPMRISPREDGIEIQVHHSELDGWAQTLGNTSDVQVIVKRHEAMHLGFVEHVAIDGTINDHRIRVIAVRPAPSVEHFHCEKCEAQFGIAGVNTGTADDDAADDYYREQVEHHETGACTPTETAVQ